MELSDSFTGDVAVVGVNVDADEMAVKFFAATAVVPEPMKGSNTISPSKLQYDTIHMKANRKI